MNECKWLFCCLRLQHVQMLKTYLERDDTFQKLTEMKPPNSQHQCVNCMQKCKIVFQENNEKLHVRKANRQQPAGSKQIKIYEMPFLRNW